MTLRPCRPHVSVARLALLGFVVAASFSRTICAAEPNAERQLRPTLPYQAQRSDPVTHQVDFSIVVTPPYHCRVLKVWVPVPPSDVAQQIADSRFSTFPMQVEARLETESVYGNRFAYFEFHEPKGAQIIRHRFSAKVWQLDWDVKFEKVAAVSNLSSEFDPYLQPSGAINQERLGKMLSTILPKRSKDPRDLLRVMQWIDQNLAYDHVLASLRADPLHAFDQRRGHCSDYHGLCGTMGRTLGYPTRVTYGISLFPKNSPSHCKMEAFLPPYGWVSFDLSETQKLVQAIGDDEALNCSRRERLITAARDRLFRGFRENCWLKLTEGTDYELVPKASQPVRLVRTAYIEADGEPLADPDPANAEQREFSWMTVHHYQADRPFKLPFKDLSTLKCFK